MGIQGIANKTSKIVIIEYYIRVKLITITCRIKEELTFYQAVSELRAKMTFEQSLNG